MATRPIRPLVRANRLRPCTVNFCKRTRKGIGHYCEMHAKARRFQGHPEAKAIPAKYYAAEVQQVAALFNAHADHAGLLKALDFFREWLAASIAGDTGQPGSID